MPRNKEKISYGQFRDGVQEMKLRMKKEGIALRDVEKGIKSFTEGANAQERRQVFEEFYNKK